MSAEQRYRNDPVFNRLVGMIFRAIVEKQYTATEVRDAAMLAAIMYEQHHVRRYGLFPGEAEIGPAPSPEGLANA